MSRLRQRRAAGRSGLWRPLAVAAAVLLGVTAQPALATAAESGATVSKELLAQLRAEGSTDFMVYLREKAELSTAARIADADDRAARVFKELTDTAARTQRGLLAELKALGVAYDSFWIANVVRVRGDQALVNRIAARAEVERIEPSRTYKLIEPVATRVTTATEVNAIEWGLTNIEAPRVWSEFGVTGEGIVVANIDTGVQHTHPALVGKYRGNLGNGEFDHNYNWFDPTGVCSGTTPCDNNGHGTHTMGTIAGDDGAGNQIGVAPGVRWIAAKGCATNSCPDAALLAAGQWVMAPTDLNGENPRPDLRADIVNNSWGGSGGDPFYQQIVNSWRAAGIFPVFSAGNSGPGCNTTGSPGDYANSYAVGSYDINNNISSFSSRGSSAMDGGIKPNIAAPGSNVRSSIPGGGYASYNGTSMAAPHVAGAIALLWSAAPALRGDLTATAEQLDRTAIDVNALGCGGTVEKNNIFGEGRLNVYQAVLTAPRDELARISGVVTDSATASPLAGVSVRTGNFNATTGADGRYLLTVPAGEHELTVSAYGYDTQTATVTVEEGGALTRNFALVASPMVTVSGKVTDGSGQGWQLYAAIEVAGRPGGPIFTDPVTGNYSFTVPGNSTYRLTVTARYPGYRTVTVDLAVNGNNKTLPIAVPVEESCTAAGYLARFSSPLLAESFDGTEAPEGWSVVNRTTGGGWAFHDLGNRGNLTGGSGNFANLDSDALGSGKSQDSDLVTPTIDLSTATAPLLRFNSDYRALSSPISVGVSTDDGATWTDVWSQTASLRGPRVEEIPLTSVAGNAAVKLRFRYQGSWAWWWQVDNVEVVDRLCTPVPGGLLAGFTTDHNTGAAVNGVTVANADNPAEKGVSAATPEDPNIGDGFYWLFTSATGEVPFTASKSPYPVFTRTATVVANVTRRADFALRSGRLTVSTTSVETHQPYGSTRSAKITVRNTGSHPATVEVLERGGDFTILGTSGAALNEYHTKAISKAATGVVHPAATGAVAAAPQEDPAWSNIRSLPASVFDNAAATLDGQVYSVGGGSGTGNERKVWRYDPADNSWTSVADLPVARAKPSVAAVGGKLYAIGGWGSGSTLVNTVDVFDPQAGTWSTLSGTTNPAPRAAAGTAVVGGKIYMVGGCADTSCTNSANLVIFDPATGTFSSGANYPHGVSWMSCGGIGGRLYCAGGAGVTDDYKDAHVYDPSADTWSALPDAPIDIWGSQYAASGGRLVLAGGVTGNSSAITNRTIAYDPSAGAWLNLPNAQFSRYRGAAACGTYKIGGSPSSFVGSADSEVLGGLDSCGEQAGGGDLEWLTATPATFTLAPGSAQVVTVSLTATAAAGIDQPGAYTAELALSSDTPYPVPPVSVEMNVSPPNNWGKVQGTVTGETCGGVETPVRAIVRIVSVADPSVGYTLSTDAQGRYGYWLPRGRYDVIVAKDGWVPQVQRIQVQQGVVSTLDYQLAPATGCTLRLGGI
jgi:subtilisin family serine protease